jgi:hypothetical protein
MEIQLLSPGRVCRCPRIPQLTRAPPCEIEAKIGGIHGLDVQMRIVVYTGVFVLHLVRWNSPNLHSGVNFVLGHPSPHIKSGDHGWLDSYCIFSHLSSFLYSSFIFFYTYVYTF